MKEANQASKQGRSGGEVRWRLTLLCAVAMILIGFILSRQTVILTEGKVRATSKAPTRYNPEIDLRFKQGVAMLNAKEYEHALTAFHRVLQLAPEMPEAHVNAGYALLGMGQYKAARDFFDTATILRPMQLNAYFGLAEAMTELGDNLGALQAMETYAHLAPKDDPFRRKAESAAWELRTKINEEKSKEPVASERENEAPKLGGRP